MMDGDQQLTDGAVVGRVARTHGRRGQIIVNPETDFPQDRFRMNAVFYACRSDLSERVTVTAVRFHHGRPILALGGIDTIDSARPLVGAELRVPAIELLPLPAGRFYHHELIGCAVRTHDGSAIGSVVAVQGNADRSLLVVHTATGEVLIPLAEEICRCIHVADRIIEIKPPEGLLDLNVTKRARSTA